MSSTLFFLPCCRTLTCSSFNCALTEFNSLNDELTADEEEEEEEDEPDEDEDEIIGNDADTDADADVDSGTVILGVVTGLPLLALIGSFFGAIVWDSDSDASFEFVNGETESDTPLTPVSVTTPTSAPSTEDATGGGEEASPTVDGSVELIRID